MCPTFIPVLLSSAEAPLPYQATCGIVSALVFRSLPSPYPVRIRVSVFGGLFTSLNPLPSRAAVSVSKLGVTSLPHLSLSLFQLAEKQTLYMSLPVRVQALTHTHTKKSTTNYPSNQRWSQHRNLTGALWSLPGHSGGQQWKLPPGLWGTSMCNLLPHQKDARVHSSRRPAAHPTDGNHAP